MSGNVERESAEQVELPKTVEQAQAAFDELRHATDVIAIKQGEGPTLAKAIAAEMGMFDRLEQLRAYSESDPARRHEAVQEYRDNSVEDGMTALGLSTYGEGGRITDHVRSEMESRVAYVNYQLDRLGRDFSHDTITELRGATDKMELHQFEQDYRELAALRDEQRGEPAPERPPVVEDETSKTKASVFESVYRNTGLEGALDKDPGLYKDQKGAAMAVEIMKELGMTPAEMADHAESVAKKYEHFVELAKTIFPDKSEQAQGRYAENQLWEALSRDPVWGDLDGKIAKYGDTLAGRGSRLSKAKIMSSYLMFARRVQGKLQQ